MNKLTLALTLGAGITASGMAVAQDASPPAGATVGGPPAACGSAAAAANAGDATISATAGAGSDAHNLKVFSCNGIRVGTAISTTSGPNGTILTVSPDANFLNGITTFQVTTKGATMGDGQIALAMTDNALRASIAASPATPATTQQ
jgi:hypothetical protein